MKLRAKRIFFIVAMCVGVLCTGLLRWPPKVQTDLASLINLGDDSDWPIQTITDKFSSVINIVVQSSDRLSGEITMHKISETIQSDEFSQLNIVVNGLSPRELVGTVGRYHNAMIGAGDRKLLLENKFSDVTSNTARHVESSMMPNLLSLSEDPFLLFTNYVSAMGNNGTNWMVQNGALWQYKAPYNFYMLPVEVATKDNTELVDTVARLKSKIAKLHSKNVNVYIAGAPVHTAEMYSHSKIEMGVISLLVILAVVVLNYLLFRRVKTIIPIGLSLVVGYLCGTIALFLCFGMAHILVFVFGTSLIGLGIDYGFHFMCIARGEDKVAVHKNILHSLVTTVICFAPLLFASIDLLRQISVFTIVGLVAIYLFIKWFRPANISYKARKLRYIVQPVHAKYRSLIICGIAVVTIIGCAFARLENNMSAMYQPRDELLAAEKVIGDLNQSNRVAFLVVRGENIQKVLETEETIRDSGVQFFSVSSVVPSLRRQAENNQLVSELYKSQAKNIKRALGLRKLPKFTPAPSFTVENMDAWLGQIEKFLVKTDGFIYSVSSVSADTIVANENARVLAPAAQIQHQMEKFSGETYRLLIICGLVLIVALVVLYGRRAFKYLMPPLFGVGISIALLTMLGTPITFFHMLGLFIVIGLGLDYAIFHINMKKDTELRPVFYSFLTSFIGFGLLAFTSFFLIAALGLILAIGIAVSYLVSLYLFRN